MGEQLPEHVDLLVVGAGSAGAAFARRSADVGDRSVLLVDAGPDPRRGVANRSVLDAATLTGAYDPLVSRGLTVELAAGRSVEVRRGRVLGGSSAVNGAYFVRGRPDDFTRWAAHGGASWAPDAVLTSFAEIEHDHDLGGRPGHGSAGPVPVRRELEPTRMTEAFFAACAAQGYVGIDDLNSPTSTDADGTFGIVPRNVAPAPHDQDHDPDHDTVADGWRRVSSAEAYLTTTDVPTRLQVATGHVVRRVLVRSGRAVGVELEPVGADRGERPRRLEASEVVLSAGAVGSAELLARSGIGPALLLRSHGLEVHADLPGLGAATFDHPCIDLVFRRDGVTDTTLQCFFQGALHLRDGVEVMATRVPYGVVTGRDPHDELLSLRVTLTRPIARGQLRWGRSLEVEGVAQHALGTAADRTLARRAVRVACELAAHPALASLIEQWFGPRPGELASDDDLDAWIGTHLGTAFHLAGSAPMGPSAERGAVVSGQLRVHGVDGLRVVDASVMPEPLSRGPAATAIMLGDHAAAL